MNYYDHPDYIALFAGVLAESSEDAPRLVLADWLMENGWQDWGEFIQVQCELEKHSYCKNIRNGDYDASDGIEGVWVRGFDLFNREQELFKKYILNCGSWNKDFLALFGSNWLQETASWSWQWNRGFISEVSCTLQDWWGAQCTRCYPPGEYRWTCAICGQPSGMYGHPAGGCPEPSECKLCKGRGYIGGYGVDIVMAHPIERLVLTDREPYTAHFESCVVWSDYTIESVIPDKSELPNGLYILLASYSEKQGVPIYNNIHDGTGCVLYPTNEDAYDAILRVTEMRAKKCIQQVR